MTVEFHLKQARPKNARYPAYCQLPTADSRFTVFFLRRRKQNVVQNKPIAGRLRMQTQIRFGVFDVVAIVFRVVTAVKCEKALPKRAVQIANFAVRFVFAERQDFGFDVFFDKSRRLTHKTFDGSRVTLGQHGWHGVVFC